MMNLDETIDYYIKKAKTKHEQLDYIPYDILMNPHAQRKKIEGLKKQEAEYIQYAYWLKELRYDREYIQKLDEALKEIRANFKREEVNQDYFTGFISCLSNIEGTIACIKKELKDESICKYSLIPTDKPVGLSDNPE